MFVFEPAFYVFVPDNPPIDIPKVKVRKLRSHEIEITISIDVNHGG